MTWRLIIARKTEKRLRKLPNKDRDLLRGTLSELVEDPYAKVERMRDFDEAAWKRRVGSYRILFDIYDGTKIIHVVDIDRRTSKSYRKR